MKNKRKASDFIYQFYNTMPRHELANMLYIEALERVKQFGTTEKEVWEEIANDAGYDLDWWQD